MKKYMIYLAAGNSRRFGSNKLLYEYQEKPLYRHGLDMLREVAEKDKDLVLIVVTQYEQIERELKKEGIRVVQNEKSRDGIAYSIHAGIQAAGAVSAEDYVMFVVADQPWLTKKTVRKLLEYADGRTETASVIFRGRPGNPVLFSMRFKEELMALAGDQGGRTVLRRHKCRYVEASGEKELMDIDKKGDIGAKENF